MNYFITRVEPASQPASQPAMPGGGGSGGGGGSVVVLVAVTGPFFLTRTGIDGMLRSQCSKRWLTGRWR